MLHKDIKNDYATWDAVITLLEIYEHYLLSKIYFSGFSSFGLLTHIYLVDLLFGISTCFSADPSDKSMEVMRKFSEQFCRKSDTYFCVDKSVTAVVIKVIFVS